MDWWVKSVATKLLIPYDEVGTAVLGRSSRIDRESGTNTKNAGTNTKNTKELER